MENLGRTRYKEFEFYGAENNWQAEIVTAEDIYNKYGGQKTFFKKGSKILDIGSGYGRAVSDFAVKKRGVEVFGVDPIYNGEEPLDKNNGYFVAGKAESLPFRDNTFSELLAVESFPRHVPNFKTADRVMSEITRVAIPEAIFRATMPIDPFGNKLYYDETEEGNKRYADKKDAIVSLYRHYGWDYFFSPKGLLIARLENKDESVGSAYAPLR